MAQSARLALSARRFELRTFTIRVVGLDLTGVDLGMQVRLYPDTAGTPILDLATVVSAATEGLKLDSVETVEGVPISTITGRINKSTMSDNAGLGRVGEPGAPLEYAYALRIGDTTRLTGPFWALPGTIDSDAATPTGSGGSSRAPEPFNSATLKVADNEVVKIVVDGAEAVGAIVARAEQALADTVADNDATAAQIAANNEATVTTVTAKASEATAAAASATATAAQIGPYIVAPAAASALNRLLQIQLYKQANGVTLAWPANIGVREIAADGFDRFRFRVGGGVTLDGNSAYPEIARENASTGLNRPYAGLTSEDQLLLYASDASLGVPAGTVIGTYRIMFNGTTFGTYGIGPVFPHSQGGLKRSVLLPTAVEEANIQSVAKQDEEIVAALDYVAEFGSAFDPTSTAIPPELASRVKRIYFENGKGHDLSVYSWRFNTTSIAIVISDEVLNDQVGQFVATGVDYNNLPDRLAFTAGDPLDTLPSGDPDGANSSPLRGYIEFHEGTTALGAVTGGTLGPAQPALGEVRINRRNVKHRLFASVAHPLLRDFAEVIEVGAGRTFANARAALDTLLDVPQPTDSTETYTQSSKYATINHQIAILIDPGTYLDSNLFFPSNVSLIARYPDAVFFEHTVGATRPIFQLIGNHLFADINAKNTEPEGTGYTTSTTSSARYAYHFEDTHGVLTKYPQSDDYTQDFKLTILRGSSTVGVSAGIQPIGMAIPANATVEILDHDLYCENPAYTGPLISANTSSLSLGGGRLIVRNCRNLTERDDSNPGNSVSSSVAVQTKLPAAPYPNELILESNLHFGKIALSGSAGTAGMWKLRGNWQGIVHSTIAGDDMGYL